MRTAPEILVVDDNPADILLVRESLAETSQQSHVHSVTAADDAIAYVRGQSKYLNRARPDLVMLDLNLVHHDGHKVIAELKSCADSRDIPVVVFSSSESTEDIRRSYWLGANCYISKPADLKRFSSAIRAVEEFWFRYVTLPQKGE